VEILVKVVKKTKSYIIFKKKTGRYGVRGVNKVWIRGNEKVKILVEEGLLDASTAVSQEEEKKVENTISEEKTKDSTAKDSVVENQEELAVSDGPK